MIKTEQLRYLVELDKTNSFHKCADNLYLSQPAISLSIRNLEKELGVTLFTRTSTGVYPTEIGTKVIQQAKEILLHINHVQTLCKEHNSTQAQFTLEHLDIYSLATISAIILPSVVSALQKNFPTASFLFHEQGLEEIFPLISQNSYSIGFHFIWEDDLESILQQYPNLKIDMLHPLFFYLATTKTAAFRPKTAIQLDGTANQNLQIPLISYEHIAITTQQIQKQLIEQNIAQLVFSAPNPKLFNTYISQGLGAGLIAGLGNNKFLSTNEELAQLVFTPIETNRKCFLVLLYHQALPAGLHQLILQYVRTQLERL